MLIKKESLDTILDEFNEHSNILTKLKNENMYSVL